MPTSPSRFPFIRSILMMSVMILSLFLAPLYFSQRSNMTTELWVMVAIIMVAITLCLPVLSLTIGSTWHNYHMARLDYLYQGRPPTVQLAAFLNAYYQAKRRPASFTFAACLYWVNKTRRIIDVDHYLDALEELERDGDIIVDRPADGSLVISLTKQFHKRLQLNSRSTRQ